MQSVFHSEVSYGLCNSEGNASELRRSSDSDFVVGINFHKELSKNVQDISVYCCWYLLKAEEAEEQHYFRSIHLNRTDNTLSKMHAKMKSDVILSSFLS